MVGVVSAIVSGAIDEEMNEIRQEGSRKRSEK